MPEKMRRKRRICLGTGLIALDLVVNGKENNRQQVWAGGSCGNVLTILSYLGWQSYPVARLGDDFEAKTVAQDMSQHGVNFQYVLFDQSVRTPIILQRISIAQNGNPIHRFHLKCPICGDWFPQYRPVRLKDINVLCRNNPPIDCFYFDRVSPASIRLAEMAKENGALVVLEPTHIKDDQQFRKAIALCDILKFANERVIDSSQLAYESPVKLVVETLGSEGLRYRLRNNDNVKEWTSVPAFRVRILKDTAGAGDWCTAGIIDVLTNSGVSFDRIGEMKIIDALRYGQALSVLNCSFEGARGAMYGIKKSNFSAEIQSVLDREEAWMPDEGISLLLGTKNTAQWVCPACGA